MLKMNSKNESMVLKRFNWVFLLSYTSEFETLESVELSTQCCPLYVIDKYEEALRLWVYRTYRTSLVMCDADSSKSDWS